MLGGGGISEARARLRAQMAAWFPEREFFMRSEGRVRFIRISPRLQMAAAGAVAALVLGWVLTIAGIALAHLLATHDHASLLTREARVENAEARVAAYRNGISGVAGDLQRRQDFIERMVQAHLGDLPQDQRQGETVSNSASAATQTINKVSLAVPEAAPLAWIEARQLAFIEGLTRFADRHAEADAAHLRHLGLDPDAALARQAHEAQGGPLEALATSADGSLDPRFARLGASLARMDALAHDVQSLPQVAPAHVGYVSSSYGYRIDPFTHAGSFHPGLDFPGPKGAPIYAAARGTVSFAGVRSGYGNCVEIDHGNGLMTRYGHMSALRSHVGEVVAPGQLIGLIGSTGRSTGPHLHFEVRINDRPVNPRPFLEAPHVSQNNTGNSASARQAGG